MQLGKSWQNVSHTLLSSNALLESYTHSDTVCVSEIMLQGCVDVFFLLTQQETAAQK